MSDITHQWPEVFDTKVVDGHSDAELCADGLTAWGNCHAGAKPHPNFGEVLVMIGTRLGITATGGNLMKKSKDYE